MAPKDSVKTAAQHTQFAAIARELGCDESEATFNTQLEKVARAAVPRKPATKAKPSKPARVSKVPDKPSEMPKKKTRFILPGA